MCILRGFPQVRHLCCIARRPYSPSCRFSKANWRTFCGQVESTSPLTGVRHFWIWMFSWLGILYCFLLRTQAWYTFQFWCFYAQWVGLLEPVLAQLGTVCRLKLGRCYPCVSLWSSPRVCWATMSIICQISASPKPLLHGKTMYQLTKETPGGQRKPI